jgi:hypothetical protein
MYVPGRMRWAHVQTCETRTDDELGGAFLMSGGARPLAYSGSAGMTSSSYASAFYPPPAPRPHNPRPPPAPLPPAAPPRALVPGLRAPKTEEAALLPVGSVIYFGDGRMSYGYEKTASGAWVDHEGEELDGTWTGCPDEVVLRVGDGTQPGAYLAPDCSPDALVDLLLSRADLRDALAARVPALRDLADALRELVGLQGGGS